LLGLVGHDKLRKMEIATAHCDILPAKVVSGRQEQSQHRRRKPTVIPGEKTEAA
jgi:hypothetical protein